jgi:hypothetical protein
VIPLKRSLADKLRTAKPTDANPCAHVFKRSPKRETFLKDCARAGFPTKDAEGRTVDRHSLRKTFVTWLSMFGVAPRTAQQLARHTSLDLTMKVYTDDRLLDGVSAVEALPDLRDAPATVSATARATGTDGASANPVVLPVVLDSGEQRGTAGNAASGSTGAHPKAPAVKGAAFATYRKHSSRFGRPRNAGKTRGDWHSFEPSPVLVEGYVAAFAGSTPPHLHVVERLAAQCL